MRAEEGRARLEGPAEPMLGIAGAPRVSVLVPLYNEAPTLQPLYEAVRTVCEREGLSFEIVYVDDGSEDGSLAVLTALARQDTRVRVIRLRRNFGKAAALSTGFRAARGRSVVTMDADLQDDPEEIPRLLARLSDGFGVVSGWKRKRHDPVSRRLASKVFNWATRRLSRVKLHDFNCGLKAYSNECAKDIAGSCYGELHRYLPVLAHYKGFAVTEMEVNHRERTNGRSRYGLERYLRGFLDLLTAVFMSRYTRRPMHVFGGIGMALFIPGAGALLWLGVIKLAFNAYIGGRPLLIMGAVLCIAGLQLMLTGLLAEMISAPRAAEVPYSPVIVLPEVEAEAKGEAEAEPSVVVLSEEELARVQPLRRRWANKAGA
jgi:glycosyltransferase involved in cell wall biosynthesis